MVTQPVTQETRLPGQFGEWLDQADRQITRTSRKAVELSGNIPFIERHIQSVEKLADYHEWFVDFVHQAGQDDAVAARFDAWTEDLGPLGVFELVETTWVSKLEIHASILRKTVADWDRRVALGIIKPDLPPKLKERIAQLDERIQNLTEQITKREDNELVARLLIRVGNHRPLTGTEKIRLSDAVRIKVQFKTEPSIYREDWYGEDGR